MAGDVLSLTDVTVARDGAELLAGVNWTVSTGERWVVLGPNGAGKTTLLQIAATLLMPTEGTVDVLGGRLGRTDVFELRPRVGYASPALADALPKDELVRDVVMTAAWGVLGRSREDYSADDSERADELLAQLGCRRLSSRRFGTLSEGERKRVQIARALMTDPELLLLDEPAAGLDLGAREALLRRLARIVTDPLAPVMVLVSHVLEEVPPSVTHALLLRQGRVVAAGPVREVMTAAALSECFGIPLDVGHDRGRYTARMMPGVPPRFPSAPVASGAPG